MEFKADLRDIKFVVFEVIRAQELAKHPRYREVDKDLLEAVIDEAFKFAHDVLSPVNEIGDRQGSRLEAGKVTMAPEIVDGLRKWGANGWGGTTEDPTYGGQGLPLIMASVVNELFTAANCALSLVPMLTVGAAHLLEQFGPDWLKKICLPNLYSFKWMGTMCLTEPQAGSDVGASKAKAFRQDDGTYRIVGTKNFITGGDHDASENIIHMVLARVEGAAAGTRGLSLFLIPKFRFDQGGKLGEFNDVAATGIEHKLGIHGTPTCTMNFGDNDRCIGYIIGEENAGMKLMFHLMNEARLWVGMQGLALAGASYLQSLQYARERLQGSDVREFKNPNAPKAPIIRHPDVRRMLMTMKAHTEAMRSLFLTIAYMEDRMRTAATPEERQFYQGMVELFTPICKAYGSETGFAVTSVGVQVLGGYGYCCEFPHEQYMRDCRIAAIYEGANGIQAMDLFSRKVPMDKGRLFKAYIGEVDRFLADHKGKRPCIEDILTAVEKAKDLLVKTTLHLGKVAGADLALGLSQATPYLKMFGHVACAFELAKQAVLAHSRLDEIYAQRCVEQDEEKKKAEKRRLYETNADVNFYKSKIHTARFFAKNILPEADGLAAGMLSDDPSALEVLFGLEAE